MPLLTVFLSFSLGFHSYLKTGVPGFIYLEYLVVLIENSTLLVCLVLTVLLLWFYLLNRSH